MIVEHDRGREVLIRYRDPTTLKRLTHRIQQHPYFFVHRDEMPLDDEGWAYAKEQGVSSVVDKGHKGVGGEPLLKVSCHYPSNVMDIRNNFKQTWEANIPFTTRALAESDFEVPMYDHRVWSLDAEWLVDSGRINMITVHDSYTDKLYTWFINIDDESHKKVSEMKCVDHPEGLESIHFDPHAVQCTNEKELLTLFARKMMEHDPDVLMGWYLVGADIKQIAGRMRANKLNPAIMSPMRKHRYDYGDWEQPIPGRICFDLMLGFVKLWTVKNGQLPGRKLDDVAAIALGERKVELDNGHDTYYTDLATYIDYNRQDVRLLPRLNDMLNCLNHYLTLMHLCKSDFRATPHVTKLTTALLLNDDLWVHRIPTRPQHAYVPYSGADIMEPEAGVYENLGILDIRAMYHSNVNLHNISWETLSEDGVDCGNGIQFHQNEQGAVGRLMDYLTNLRNEYKANKKNATDQNEAKKWDAMQYATKSLIASLYGVCGDEKYSLYHPKVADAITFTSRQTLGRLRDLCNEKGNEVVYGHTDSVFVRINNPDEGLKLCEELNVTMHPIVIEFERWAESMLIKAKNRYAGMVTWVEGNHLDEPDYYVKGIELKQARMPKAMKDTMMTTLRGILHGKTQDEVSDELCGLITQITNGEMPIEDLCMKGSLSKPLHQYNTLSGTSAAADWAYRNLGIEYGEDDYFLCLLDEEGKYIGFDKPEQIQGLAKVGYKHIAQRFIVNKASDLYDVVGWDMTPLMVAMEGKQNVVWL